MTIEPARETMHVETDVLIVGSGGAGMYAAIEAARAGASVFLADRSLVGRGGATVMAQMTVAVALGSQTPDHWRHHLADTIQAGRGLTDQRLARLLCEDGPDCIREMDTWGVGWARRDGRITQAFAPGHDRPRCAYVDFLNTGPAVSKTLRTVVNRTSGIRKAGDLLVVDLVRHDGAVTGAVALHLASGAPVTIAAKATIVAAGGLTRLYRRNSASANMGGDGYALAMRAGAPLIPTGCYFLPGGRGEARIGPPLPIARTGHIRRDVQDATQALAARFEHLIRAAPEDWHLMQPNWPSDRAIGT